MIVTEELDEWDGFIAAWLPGTEGTGVADVLFEIQSNWQIIFQLAKEYGSISNKS